MSITNVETWLLQVKKLDELISAKTAERDRLIEIATDISPKSMDGMPFDNTGTVSQKIPNAVIKIIEVEKDLDKIIAQYIDLKKKIVARLEMLPPNEYGVLHRHYIRYMTWEQVAEDMNFTTVHVWRIKNKGLEKLQGIKDITGFEDKYISKKS